MRLCRFSISLCPRSYQDGVQQKGLSLLKPFCIKRSSHIRKKKRSAKRAQLKLRPFVVFGCHISSVIRPAKRAQVELGPFRWSQKVYFQLYQSRKRNTQTSDFVVCNLDCCLVSTTMPNVSFPLIIMYVRIQRTDLAKERCLVRNINDIVDQMIQQKLER